ncbi:MAG: glycosyltransferase family A protein [Pacificimonas sp.]|jgi:glycosyltransferase involved in cell wall biosynthesis|nr:glycosyltransferase family A protein [Pacificimonas sp.]
MSARPVFSIITPLYRAAHDIPDLFACVAAQTERAFELILIDDASHDDTVAAARRAAATAAFPVQLLKRETNGGPAAARNDGIEAACGDIIAFLDADDRWSADLLTAHGSALSSRANVSMSALQGDVVGPSGTVIEPVIYGWVFSHPDPARALLWSSYLQTSGVAVRKAVLTGRPFDESLRTGEDRDLFIQVAMSGGLTLNPRPLFAYRRTAGSAMARASAGDYRANAAMIDRNLARFGDRLTSAEVRRARAKAQHDLGEHLLSSGGGLPAVPPLARALLGGYEPVRTAKKIAASLIGRR